MDELTRNNIDETQFCKNLTAEKFRTQLTPKTHLEREILYKLYRAIMLQIAANSRNKLEELNELQLPPIYQIYVKIME